MLFVYSPWAVSGYVVGNFRPLVLVTFSSHAAAPKPNAVRAGTRERPTERTNEHTHTRDVDAMQAAKPQQESRRKQQLRKKNNCERRKQQTPSYVHESQMMPLIAF